MCITMCILFTSAKYIWKLQVVNEVKCDIELKMLKHITV